MRIIHTILSLCLAAMVTTIGSAVWARGGELAGGPFYGIWFEKAALNQSGLVVKNHQDPSLEIQCLNAHTVMIDWPSVQGCSVLRMSGVNCANIFKLEKAATTSGSHQIFIFYSNNARAWQFHYQDALGGQIDWRNLQCANKKTFF